MDVRTGDLYETKQDALDAGVPEQAIVEISGPSKAIRRLRMAAKNENARRKARRQQQKAARKRNR